MKNRLWILWAMCCFSFAVQGWGQQVHSSGVLTYKIKDVTLHDQSKRGAKMMEGQKIKIYFTPTNQRINMSFMGGMGKMSIIRSSQDTNVTMLMKVMGQKMKMTVSEETANNLSGGKGAGAEEDLEVVHHHDQTREILGFKTHLVEVKGKPIEDGGDALHLTLYVSDAIKTPLSISESIPASVELKGVPLEYTIDVPGSVRMKYVAVKYEEEVDDEAFDIPEDYQEMDPSILQGMSGN